jgi:hypothetical protein
MNRSTENFFALLHLLNSSRTNKRHSPARAAAAGIVKHEIMPIIRSAFEVYPEKDIDEVLVICEPALTEALFRIIER